MPLLSLPTKAVRGRSKEGTQDLSLKAGSQAAGATDIEESSVGNCKGYLMTQHRPLLETCNHKTSTASLTLSPSRKACTASHPLQPVCEHTAYYSQNSKQPVIVYNTQESPFLRKQLAGTPVAR